MRHYDVTEWAVEPDTVLDGREMGPDWTLGSGGPPVRVLVGDEYEAVVRAGYTGPKRGILRPKGEKGMFFKEPDQGGLTGNVFQAVDAGLPRPGWQESTKF